jgi:hypothetical protein
MRVPVGPRRIGINMSKGSGIEREQARDEGSWHKCHDHHQLRSSEVGRNGKGCRWHEILQNVNLAAFS